MVLGVQIIPLQFVQAAYWPILSIPNYYYYYYHHYYYYYYY